MDTIADLGRFNNTNNAALYRGGITPGFVCRWCQPARFNARNTRGSVVCPICDQADKPTEDTK